MCLKQKFWKNTVRYDVGSWDKIKMEGNATALHMLASSEPDYRQ